MNKNAKMGYISFVLTTVLCATLSLGTSAAAGEEFNAYASPGVYGPEVIVASHVTAVTLNISYEAVGSTSVSGIVTYFKNPDDDLPTEQAFFGSVKIRTG